MKRRSLTLGLGALGAAPLLLAGGTRVNAAPDSVGDEQAVDFPAGEPVPTLQELVAEEQALAGPDTPYPDEVRQGLAILLDSPTATTPLLVASYFLRLNEGEFGMAEALYAREWPQRANPIIVSFFDATSYRTPAGDTTAWCAAFVCWCMARAREGRGDVSGLIDSPKSAASKDFRTWGEATETPLVGDLVVFVNDSDHNRGHVGFYLGQTGDRLLLLGGNQRTVGRITNGEVTVTSYARSGSLNFHSFRTHATLHDT